MMDADDLIDFQLDGLHRLDEAHMQAREMTERGEDGLEFYLAVRNGLYAEIGEALKNH